MNCDYCGTPIPEEETVCPSCGGSSAPAPEESPVPEAAAPVQEQTEVQPEPPMTPAPVKKKKGFRPNLAARIFLRLGTWILCMCLIASLSLTALVLDARLLTSGDNLRSTISAILSPKSAAARSLPGKGATRVSAAPAETAAEEPLSETGSVETIGFILDTVYEQLEEQYGEELAFTQGQLQDFYRQSTLSDFLADKLASCIEDLLNGTDNTRITDEEISALVNDNADLIYAVFGVKVDDALRQKALDFSKEAGLEQLLREQLVGKISQLSLGEDGITVEQILAKLRNLTSLTVLWTLIAIDLVLAALLYLTNWLRLGATLRSIGIPMLTVGGALSAPILLIDLLVSPSDTALYPIVHTLYGPIIPVHYGMLAGGVLLLIAGIVVGILSRAKAK